MLQVSLRTEGGHVILWLRNVSNDNDDNNFIVSFVAHYKDQRGQWTLMSTRDGYKMVVGKKFRFHSFRIDECDKYCYSRMFHLSYKWR